jgi:diguanylate cyclase (GGDEF)-like protein
VADTSAVADDNTHRPRELDSSYLLAVLSQAQVPMIVTDPDGRVLLANDAWSAFHPVPPANLPIADWLNQFEFLDARGLHRIPSTEAPLARVLRGEVVRDYEYSVVSKDGEVRFRRASGQQLRAADGGVIGTVVAMQDITGFKLLQDELERRALLDSLTGLANRALLLDRLQHALVRSERNDGCVTVMLCDLDRFKWVNDAFGHGLGDRLIIEVGRRISAVVRASDTVARLGGDEFVILAESSTDDDLIITDMPERIRAAVGAELRLDGAVLHPSISIGVATTRGARSSAETLLRDADTAMYRVKDDGGSGSMAFDESMRLDALRRVHVRSRIEHALTNNGFRLLYQPLVDAVTGRMVSVEALIRMTDDGPPLGPNEFVPVAEECGLIEDLDRFVLHEATRDLMAWMELCGDEPFAVGCNVSGRTIGSELWTKDALATASEVGPERLKIELTETALMRAGATALTNLADLRAAGLAVGLDDFGTGFASLTHLRTLPISFLKIDRSFVFNMDTSSNDRAIVQAIIQMATSLGLESVAEGVEEVAHATLLRQMGCTLLQGYLLSRPVPAERISEILQGQQQNHFALADTLR